MESKRLFATLALQIEAARNQGDLGDEEGPESCVVPAILRSLRVTYLALSTGLDPWRDALQSFVLEVSAAGDHVLLHAGMPIPVDGFHLEQLFEKGGIELRPGQILLLDAELARTAIEEALGELALEQALAERARAQRRAAIDEALNIPNEEDLDALQELERRTSALWERKIELVAASLVAEEILERDRPFTRQDPAA